MLEFRQLSYFIINFFHDSMYSSLCDSVSSDLFFGPKTKSIFVPTIKYGNLFSSSSATKYFSPIKSSLRILSTIPKATNTQLISCVYVSFTSLIQVNNFSLIKRLALRYASKGFLAVFPMLS